MKFLTITITTTMLIVVATLAPHPAAAKCNGPEIQAESGSREDHSRYREIEWGEKALLNGFCWAAWSGGEQVWTADEVAVYARFLPASPDFDSDVPSVPSLVITDIENASFQATFRSKEISGAPETPQPGWIEFIARAGDVEARTSIVVTAEGHRPPDAGYVVGTVHNLRPPPQSVVVVWTPVDDPSAYKYAFVTSDGPYRTGYLAPGEWFIGLYDVSELQYGIDQDLETASGYARELGREVTLQGRRVTIAEGQVLQGVDFTLSDTPGSTATASLLAVDSGASEGDGPSISGAADTRGLHMWLGPFLLAIVGAPLLAFVSMLRWRDRRAE